MNKITFEEYFESKYGTRWSALRSALLESDSQVMRPIGNPNTKMSFTDAFELEKYTSDQFEKVNTFNSDGTKDVYVMDPASVVAALSLEVSPSDFVLDMCAAPGGKTLILLEALIDGELWSNEISSARRGKLKEVIRQYALIKQRSLVFIKGKDGNRYGLGHENTFDKILVDAPCSGERHLLNSKKELDKWSIKRTKRLATAQYSLLCSALLALKPGGQLVYSTCSISPLENDEVIRKLLQKKNEHAELIQIDSLPDFVEKTEFGYHVLPDRSNFGPIYFTKIQKK